MDLPGSIEVVLHLDHAAPTIHGWAQSGADSPAV